MPPMVKPQTPKKIVIQSAIGGVVRSCSAEEQPAGTCSNALNVLPYDVGFQRKRVGQRYGISQFTASGGSYPIQGMEIINYLVQPGAVIIDPSPVTITSTTGAVSDGGVITGAGTAGFNVSNPTQTLAGSWTVQFAPYVNHPSVGGLPLVGFTLEFWLGNVGYASLSCGYASPFWRYLAVTNGAASQLGTLVNGSTFESSTYSANFSVNIQAKYNGVSTLTTATISGNGDSQSFTSQEGNVNPSLANAQVIALDLTGDEGNDFRRLQL